MVDLIQVLESDLEGLLRMRGEEFSSREAELYHPILLTYLSGDHEGLKYAVESVEKLTQNEPALEVLVVLGKLRQQIRTRDIRSETIERAIEHAKRTSLWRGELHFALSNATSALDAHARSRDHSLAAARALKQIGAKKKAIRALMNAISSESCVRPEKHYLADLHYIYREAKASGDPISVGNTLVNLSREYQKLGLFSAALKYAHRAVAVYSKGAGSLDYHLALAHRAHLFCQLGSILEAQADVELAMNCAFPEVHAALGILKESFSALRLKTHSEPVENVATPSWRERKTETPPRRVAKLEARLIELLTRRSHSKRELCEILYGDRLPFEVTENRLNNLLNRIRKHKPDLILFSEGKYRLSERPFYPDLQEA